MAAMVKRWCCAGKAKIMAETRVKNPSKPRCKSGSSSRLKAGFCYALVISPGFLPIRSGELPAIQPAACFRHLVDALIGEFRGGKIRGM